MIKNINDLWGEPAYFASVEEMKNCISECGYELPHDGLIEGRDYEVIDDEF